MTLLVFSTHLRAISCLSGFLNSPELLIASNLVSNVKEIPTIIHKNWIINFSNLGLPC